MLNLRFLFADVDECEMTENICGANSTCQNYDGGFNCTCDAGFEMIDGSCLGELNYRPQGSCGKVKFLHMSVILSTGPLDRHHPPTGRPPPGQTPSPRRLLKQTARTLLECILVWESICLKFTADKLLSRNWKFWTFKYLLAFRLWAHCGMGPLFHRRNDVILHYIL